MIDFFSKKDKSMDSKDHNDVIDWDKIEGIFINIALSIISVSFTVSSYMLIKSIL